MHRFQKLVVWQRAHALSVALYGSDALDDSYRYRDLVRQLRRCAGSISANIAEGAGSSSRPAFANYLGIALASAHELECHLLLARDIGCIKHGRDDQFAREAEEIKRMLTVLQQRIRSATQVARRTNGSSSS
jgi:four helix bundle protein